MPASFNFPHTGKLLSLSFVLFAGWFADTRVPLSSYPRLAGAGLLAMFGNVNAAIPFLLDLLRIPADTFRLFVTSGIVNARFGTLVAAVHTVAIAVLGTCAVTQTLTIDARKMLRFAIITLVLTAALVGGTRVLLQTALNRPYDKDIAPVEHGDAARPGRPDAGVRQPRRGAAAAARHRIGARSGARGAEPFASAISTTACRTCSSTRAASWSASTSRWPSSLPAICTSTPNSCRSAAPSSTTGLDPALCDVVMSGVAITADRAARTQFTTPYLDETLAFDRAGSSRR